MMMMMMMRGQMTTPSLPLVAILLLCACPYIPVTHAAEIQVNPANENIHILQTERITVVAGWDGLDGPIVIHSDVPVSSMRYNDHDYLMGATPIDGNDMILVVNSDCPPEDLEFVPQIEYTYVDLDDDDDDVSEETMKGGPFSTTYRPVTGVTITMVPIIMNISGASSENAQEMSNNSSSNNDTGFLVLDEEEEASQQDLDDLSFLPPSSFWAVWDYTSGMCQSFNNDYNKNNNNNNNVGKSMEGGGNQPVNGNTSSGGTKGGFWQGTQWGLAVAVGLSGLLLSTSTSRRSSHTFLVMATMSIVLVSIAVYGLVLEEEQQGGGGGGSAGGAWDLGRDLQQDATTTKSSSICKVNVEILHDGCRFNPLQVTAPATRLIDVLLQNQDRASNDDDVCTTTYQANLTFPLDQEVVLPPPPVTTTTTTTTTVSRTMNETLEQVDEDRHMITTSMPQLERYESCFRAVEGRPFIDATGHPLQASATLGIAQEHGWSTASDGPLSISTTLAEPDPLTTTVTTNKDETTTSHDKKLREALGEEWTQRALGEHASISSFAAFTIALMSNNAPPDLVQGSLTAASDEVRHAKTSFEVASYFLGDQAPAVEPGPLPQSSHRFEQNITALALATAREGCMEETLSALIAALEVDEQLVHSKMGFLTEKELSWLKSAVRTIAIEEATHSALAWRTIEWICQTNDEACKIVQTHVLEKDRLEKALERRMKGRSSESLQKAKEVWASIYNELIPLVTAGTTTNNKPVFELLEPLVASLKDKSLAELISRLIVHGVVSPLGGSAKEYLALAL